MKRIGKVYNPLIISEGVTLLTSINSKDIIKLYDKFSGVDVSKYFTNTVDINLYQCNATGYRFYYPFNLAGEESFYDDIQQKKHLQGVEYYRDWSYDHQFAKELFFKDAKILEIGCGTGKFYEGIQSITTDYTGLELNKQAVTQAKEKGINIHNELIEEHCKNNPGVYDFVCAFQVLEHIADVGSFLSASLVSLKKGGMLIIGVPNNEPYFQRFNKFETFNLPPHHMGLWNLGVFKKLTIFFPLSLKQVVYAPKNERILVDAYLRAKLWSGVKSLPRFHSVYDKFKMLMFAPVTIPLSLIKRYSSGINGGYIAVAFEKI